MPIIAKQLTAIGAKRQKFCEEAVSFAGVPQELKVAGGQSSDENQQEKMADRKPEGGQAHQGSQEGKGVGGKGAEILEGEPDRKEKGEKGKFAGGGADNPEGTGKGHEDPRNSAPAADRSCGSSGSTAHRPSSNEAVSSITKQYKKIYAI